MDVPGHGPSLRTYIDARLLCAASDDPRTLAWPPYHPSVAKGRPRAEHWFEPAGVREGAKTPRSALAAGGVTPSASWRWAGRWHTALHDLLTPTLAFASHVQRRLNTWHRTPSRHERRQPVSDETAVQQSVVIDAQAARVRPGGRALPESPYLQFGFGLLHLQVQRLLLNILYCDLR